MTVQFMTKSQIEQLSNPNDVAKAINKTKRAQRELEYDRSEIKEKLDYLDKTIEDEVKEAKEEYVEAQLEKINQKYTPDRERLSAEIDAINARLESKKVDDTPELIEAKERLDYLNGAAKVMDRHYQYLIRTSNPYFISLAYSEDSYGWEDFKKKFEGMEKRIKKLDGYLKQKVVPFTTLYQGKKRLDANLGLYGLSILGSPVIVLSMFPAISAAVKRAKFLHAEAAVYHKMMHSLVKLETLTNDEIKSIFAKILKSETERLMTMLESKVGELEVLTSKYESERDAVAFDDRSIRVKLKSKGVELKSQLEEKDDLIQKAIDCLSALKEREEELMQYMRSQKEETLNKFFTPQEERLVVLPDRLILDDGPLELKTFELKHGLYLYEEREHVTTFINLITFQLRNVMDWGSVKFKVLDLLGGGFIAPLTLPNTGKAKAQDITIHGLAEERTQIIDLLHDILVRRKIQILQTVSCLGDYNLLQKNTGSAPMAYELVYILVNEQLRMDEKLVQLVHTGEQLGILVFLFVKKETFTLQIAKTTEQYFPYIMELSSDDFISYTPKEYIQDMELQENDKKSNM